MDRHSSIGLLGIRDEVKANVEYISARRVYGTTLRIPGGFLDPPSSSADGDLNSHSGRLTNTMRSTKPVSTQPH